MNHCLIVLLDQCRVMQYDNLSLKVKDTLRVTILVNENHAFSELCSLKLHLLIYSLDTEAYSLPRECLIDWSALVMDTLHNDRVELSRLVRAKQESCPWDHSTRFHCPCNDNTDTGNLVDTIYQELNWVTWGLEVTADVYA